MRTRTFAAAALTLVLAVAMVTAALGRASALEEATDPTITGTVNVIGKRTNANAVVYIDAVPGQQFAPAAEPVRMDQKDLKFVPYVLPVLVGTTVVFENSDNVLHNVFTPDRVADRFDLGTFPRGEARSHTFDKVGGAVMLCNVHPEMEAWVVAVPTPYYALTDEAGAYLLQGFPVGTYTVKVWHPGLKEPVERQVDVGAGTTTIDLEITPR